MRKQANETTIEFVSRRSEKQAYRLIQEVTLTNPKKHRQARRKRNPLPSRRVVKYVSMSKYKPAKHTTKADK